MVATQTYYEEMERKHQRISALVTTVIAILLALLAWFWVIVHSTIPPEDEKDKQFETIAAIDFGNRVEGSRDVNTKERPSPTPKPEAPKETAAPAKPVPAKVEPVISTFKDAPVETQEAEPTPKKVEAPPAPPKKKALKLEASDSKKSSATDGGGSNHGDGDKVGNRGTPNTETLFKMGGETGGPGIEVGGLGKRKALHTPNPVYDAQEEGIIIFEVLIDPKGSVIKSTALRGGSQAQLKRNCEKALKQWRFSPIPDKKNQTVTVKFTFNLK